MNKYIKIIVTLLIMSSFFAISTINVEAVGAGLMPSRLEIYDALKGETYVRSIRLFNAGDESIGFALTSSGEISEWVTFYRATNLTEPITNITVLHKESIMVKFSIPQTIANGNYNGTVYAETIPLKIDGEENTTTGFIKLKLPANVQISVTGEQILSGNVTEIRTNDVEAGQSLIVEFNFENTGNVIATPLVIIQITREGWPIDTVEYSETSIETNTDKNMFVEWNTLNREPGLYNASVSVMLNGEILAYKNLTFSLLPRGTLTREGELTSLTYNGTADIGNTIKILGNFNNTGLIELEAHLILEIYKNGILIDTLESNKAIIPRRDSFVFIEYFKIKEPGEYTIKGYVVFETNATSPLTINFIVDSSLQHLLVAGLSTIAIIFTVVVLYIKYPKLFSKTIIKKINPKLFSKNIKLFSKNIIKKIKEIAKRFSSSKKFQFKQK